MNTEKSKNIVIIILVLLNAVIFGLNVNKNNAYRLTAAQERAITAVLEQNRISCYATFIGDFSPRKRLIMSPFDYSVLEHMLLGDGEWSVAGDHTRNTAISESGRAVTYRNYNKFTFEAARTPDTETPVISDALARSICEDFLDDLITQGGLNFTFKYIYTQSISNYYNVLFLGVYKDTTISSNYMLFSVDGQGISVLNCSLAIPGGFTGPSLVIYSVDEALYTLVTEIKQIYPDTAIRITDMELVYSLTERAGQNSLAEPMYMFTVKWESSNPDELNRHHVNAYTNKYSQKAP